MDKKAIELELKREYDKEKYVAQNKAHQNLSQAMQNKDFQTTFEQIRDLDFEIAKNSSNTNIQKILQNEQKSLKKRLREITESIGFKISDFTPKYKCTLCKDTGKINNKHCICYKKRYIKKLQDALDIKLDEKHTFDNYREDIIRDEKQRKEHNRLKSLFMSYADKYPIVKSKNMLICGNTGVGKTFLMECLAHRVIDRGISLNFISSFNMNQLFIKYHTTFSDDKNKYLAPLLQPEILMIDDLGTEPINKNVTVEYLYTIITERLNADKATIISTNLMPSNILDRYGERIFSRLSFKTKSLIIKMEGEDLRLIQK